MMKFLNIYLECIRFLKLSHKKEEYKYSSIKRFSRTTIKVIVELEKKELENREFRYARAYI